jgi:HPr kinase/phosphorylase
LESVAESVDFIYNGNGCVKDAKTKDARSSGGKRRNAMRENGLKVKDFVSLFNLEVLNQGSDFDSALLTVPDLNRPGLQFHSFYDYFDPCRLQVIGKAEVTYLRGLSDAQRRKCFDDLFLYDIPALVIARSLDCFPECIESAREHQKTLLRTNEVTVAFTSRTIEYLNRVLAPCVTRHGVLLDIYGEGVMITGDSGVGKSEAAIELIMRGHRLVADDAVELRRVSGRLMGSAPEVIRNYIELRGIGVINVQQLFGVRAVKNEAQLDLVVNFEPWDSEKFYDRLGIEDHYVDILDIQVPTLTIPVRPGRNLASIVEVAAMNNRHRKLGYNAAQELAQKVDARADGKL